MNAEQNISATALTSLEGIRSVYFIGIGGIGMSALARYFVSRGIRVAGYDRTETPLTKELEQEGIAIHYSEDVNNIPRDADIVVYTPAIPAEHQELVYYRKEGFRVVKRSDVFRGKIQAHCLIEKVGGFVWCKTQAGSAQFSQLIPNS